MSAPRSSTKVRLTLSPQAEKYARRDAPLEARLMAARGALPLEAIELATVLFALLHDPDAQVKDRARQSLEELPTPVCETVLSGDAHPALLSYMARLHESNEDYAEMIALNAATDDATIAYLAELPLRRVVDIISNNQERMLRCEQIVEALGSNPLTGRAVIERILTFLGLSAVPGQTRDDDDLLGAEAVSQQAAEAALLAVLGDDMSEIAHLLSVEKNEVSDDEGVQQGLFAAVQKMSVMQKIKLARLGGTEARSLLIRDRNKVVAISVVTSPKITESEIVAISQSRNVSDEVLRLISMSRDWTRNYKVKLALATNPKSPQTAAIKFLNYLLDRDLRKVMKSRDVPTAIATHARRILTKKGRL